MSEKKKIIICGGGTLGHVLPIIPIVKSIYNEYDLYYIGTKRGPEEKYFKENNVLHYFKKVFFLDMVGINRKNIFKNFKVLFKYYKTSNKVKNIYKTIKPNLVIGMGGYISGVCINIAVKSKIKTLIHEQNSVLGLSNKLVYKKVNRVLLSYDIEGIKNCKIVGNPRYSEVKENYKKSEENKILIVSGSIGSKKINDLIIKNIEKFLIEGYIIEIVVGRNYYKNNLELITQVKNKYKGKVIIREFLNNLVMAMAKASLVVSRSGATTLSEIIALKVPAILIPSINVSANHQYYNALKLSEKKACVLIEEKDLSVETLLQNINDIILNYSYKKSIISNLDNIVKNDPKLDFINEIKEIL